MVCVLFGTHYIMQPQVHPGPKSEEKDAGTCCQVSSHGASPAQQEEAGARAQEAHQRTEARGSV